MSGNTFGSILRLTSFGESHGPAVGGVLDGFPAGINIDPDFIQHDLNRRRPGISAVSSARTEKDKLEILSGIFEGMSLGTPIGFLVRNLDAMPSDYEALRDVFRPSHADFTYLQKYGLRDHRGGGRSSARETIVRVAGGAFAKIFLQQHGIQIRAFTSAVGPVVLDKEFGIPDLSSAGLNHVCCPDPLKAEEMLRYLEKVKEAGDSSGSIVSCIIAGCPAGLGEPVFDKLEADLGKAMLSINACAGFEFGSGFEAARGLGSANNDPFITGEGIHTASNHSGGIQGGISNGNDIVMRMAFKPPPSIHIKQTTVNTGAEEVSLEIQGRHDVCIAPRAVPVTEAMAALVIADHLLRFLAYR